MVSLSETRAPVLEEVSFRSRSLLSGLQKSNAATASQERGQNTVG